MSKKILLGVTGGIAAYKTPELVRLLRAQGHIVRVVLTPTAATLVSAVALQAVSALPVVQTWADADDGMDHIALAKWADVILIAPATAHCIAKVAHGLADDILTTLILASTAQVYIAPAMNQQMWHHVATQQNCDLLQQQGVKILGPAYGEQACGDVGLGRLLSLSEIVQAVTQCAATEGILKGQHVLITAGPTHEAIDPVRYLGNHSTGRMGYALAAEAQALGAVVTLVSGPTNLPVPSSVKCINTVSAADMYDAVHAVVRDQDIFIATAAVADYTQSTVLTHKISKSEDKLQLTLQRTKDILASVYALPERPFCVGFCAQTKELHAHAQRKLHNKADIIVANEVGHGRGFGNVASTVYLHARGCDVEALTASDKQYLAEVLWQKLYAHFCSEIDTGIE